MRRLLEKRLLIALLATAAVLGSIRLARTADEQSTASSMWVHPGADGKLEYYRDAQGNRIPDFSYAGYMGGGVRLPEVPTVKTVSPVEGEDGAAIQAAIDEVSNLAPDADGFRGAVLLTRGTYEVTGALNIRKSGVVLRGEGNGPEGTIIKALGANQHTVINIAGMGNRAETAATRKAITDPYVPVGARSFNVVDASGFQVGDDVLVVRTPNQEWIDSLGMDACTGVGTPYDTSDVDGSTCLSESFWKPGDRIMRYERKITAINGNEITVDGPMVEAFQAEFGGGYLAKYQFTGRIEKCGVEYLRSESIFASDTDENHATWMVSLGNVQNAWVRNVTSVYFVQGSVTVTSGYRKAQL